MFIIKLGDNDMAKTTKGFFKMEMLLLKIISEGDCYGYQIVQTLDKISNGTIHIAEGTMYPILYRLLDEGLISDEKRLVGKRQTSYPLLLLSRQQRKPYKNSRERLAETI